MARPTEILRVLTPGGDAAFSDWFGSEQPPTPEYVEWLDVIGLTFEMAAIESAAALMADVGFTDIQINDRNHWYAQNILEELAMLEGENFDRLAAKHGIEFAQLRLRSSTLKKTVVDQGLLRPGHVRARKAA